MPRVSAASPPPEFPRGARGDRPVRLDGVPYHVANELLDIPGVVRAGPAILLPWDALPIVERRMLAAGCPISAPPIPMPTAGWLATRPGIERFKELLPSMRPHQPAGALFLAFVAGGGLGDECRLGKSACALYAAELVGCRRLLAIVDARVKLVWAFEIGARLNETAVILEGRGGDEARLWCTTCNGRPGMRRGRCPECGLVGPQRLRIVRGRDAIDRAIDDARHVIVNYELLIGQTAKDAAGKRYVEAHLPGQASCLAGHRFDRAVLDELNRIRGFSTDMTRRGHSMREHTIEVTRAIPGVWGLTATLFSGFVRDAWGPLDLLTAGASTGKADRLPFSFHVQYAMGHKGQHGWVSTGEGPLARTELRERLGYLWLARTRRDVAASLAPKTRQVITVDVETDVAMAEATRAALAAGANRRAKIDLCRRATARVKMDTVADAVAADVLGGLKTLAFAFNPDTATELAKAVSSVLQKRENGPLARQVRAEVWSAANTTVDARHEIAARFREHDGAGVIVTTIGAMQVGINLAGAATEHWIDIHHTPAEMLQAEDRPNELERTMGLHIMYYVIPGTVDDHLIDLVLPKLETIAGVGDPTAAEVKNVLRSSPDETLDEVLARLAAGVDLSNFAP